MYTPIFSSAYPAFAFHLDVLARRARRVGRDQRQRRAPWRRAIRRSAFIEMPSCGRSRPSSRACAALVETFA